MESEPKGTTVVRFPPDSWVRYVAYITNGVLFGLCSGAHCGMVLFALARSGPHGEVVYCGMLPDRFGSGMVSLTR